MGGIFAIRSLQSQSQTGARVIPYSVSQVLFPHSILQQYVLELLWATVMGYQVRGNEKAMGYQVLGYLIHTW